MGKHSLTPKLASIIKLLKYYYKTMRLVLIGDFNQLPSIQGGNLFYDMVTHSQIKKVILTKPLRSDDKIILMNAHNVLNGEDLKPDNKTSLFWIEANNKEDIISEMNVILKSKKINLSNSCVLIPQT